MLNYQLDIEKLDELLDVLRARGYRPVGPMVRDGAIVWDELESADDLPVGWGEHQAPGEYRLERRNDAARFGFTVGPGSPKRWLFPPETRVWAAHRTEQGFETVDEPETPRWAFLGLRPCDLRAVAVQDRVFLGGPHTDSSYARRRSAALLIAVNCQRAAPTCFCTSMGSGPHAGRDDPADLVLTELLDGGHRLVAEARSERGSEVLADLAAEPASEADLRAVAAQATEATASVERTMETEGLRELLFRNLEHPRWDDVAERCMACANCTMVCPTCFCASFDDAADLSGEHIERWRRWDSCFTLQHSYLHGGSVRGTTKNRYRQWLTHKLASWHDQFGTSGCVGCGRCLTWCPVGIDLTAEVAALRANDRGATEGAWRETPENTP